MTASVGVGGAWKAINAVSVGVGGAWKTVNKGWVGVSGAWKVFYETLSIALPGTLGNTTNNTSTPVNAGFRFNPDGTYDRYNVTGSTWTIGAGNWADPTTGGIGSDYEIRCTTVSGTLSSGTAGVWESLSTAKSYVVTQSVNGTKAYDGTIEIRPNSGTAVTSSAMSLTATAEVA